MHNWIAIKGCLKQGYGVASGRSGDPRFPAGTLEMQKPVFCKLGLDLSSYFMGTLNVAIAPHKYEIISAKHTFRNVKWSPNEPAEDFSFFDCRVSAKEINKTNGLIYYPHPDTKPEHFQPSDILEVILPFIEGLRYGDELMIEVADKQMQIN
ncbi:MAG: hypothetical protein AAF635_11635 [Cyanobacteria bacterium P01_C01_bin.69]